MDAVADAVTVQLEGPETSEGAKIFAADLRRRQAHPVKID